MKVLYQCDICRKIYENLDEAKRCERVGAKRPRFKIDQRIAFRFKLPYCRTGVITVHKIDESTHNNVYCILLNSGNELFSDVPEHCIESL